MKRIGLTEAIMALRSELTESVRAAAREELRFEVGQITLELQIEVERSIEGGGGVKAWVVEIGGKGSRTLKNTHTVTIPLKPVGQHGGPVLTGSEEAPE